MKHIVIADVVMIPVKRRDEKIDCKLIATLSKGLSTTLLSMTLHNVFIKKLYKNKMQKPPAHFVVIQWTLWTKIYWTVLVGGYLRNESEIVP